jgi:DME family drug/metabolite transporter
VARLAVLFAAVCFGTTGTAQALGPDGTEPLAVGAARILVGAALLVAVAARGPRAAARWAWRPLLAAGAGVAAYQLAFFTAVQDTGVAVGTVVAIGSGPAFAGLLGRVVSRERLTARWALATGLACAGVALLVGAGAAADVSAPGVGLALLAGASYATYTVAAKALLTAGHAPEEVMARAFTLGALGLLPVLVVTGGGGLGSAGGIALVLFLGAVPTALAYVLFARGLQRLSSGETATLTLAEPLTATALGILVLGEDPTAITAAGAALVLGGLVVLAARGPRERLETPVPLEAAAP